MHILGWHCGSNDGGMLGLALFGILKRHRVSAGAQSGDTAGAALSDEALAWQLQRQLDIEDAELAAAQHDRGPPRSVFSLPICLSQTSKTTECWRTS